MTTKKDEIRLWSDSSLPDGLQLLRASCFDYRYPLHFHDEFVVAAFAGGAQRPRVGRHEGIAMAGAVMTIQPGELHAGEAVEPETGWEYCAFYPSAAFMAELADEVLGGHGQLDFGRALLRQDPDLARSLLRAHALLAGSPDPLEKESALYEAFAGLLARYGERSARGPRPSGAAPDLTRALEFLRAHSDEKISVREAAASVGLSEYHFMRSFRRKTGISVHAHLTILRLNQAKILLARGFGAAEAADAAGFYDQSHLINQFRRHFGVTPGAFLRASR